LLLERTIQGVLDGRQVETAHSRAGDAVLRRCKGRIDDRLGLEKVDGLNLVEVEWVVTRNGTVETGLEKGCPAVLVNTASTFVTLTNTSDSGIYGLAAVDVLDGGFPEDEVDELVGLE